VKLEVIPTQWAADGQVFGGGVHEDVKLTRKLAPLVAGAEAAGVVNVLHATRDERALLKGHVETQAESEKAYARAQADGSWHEGNRAQYDLDVASGVRSEG
jgi:hypothetical protein